jgi:hypothetical protein
MKQLIVFIFSTILLTPQGFAQEQGNVEDLKREIMQLRTEVDAIHFNLGQSRSKFKGGILVATLGYSITITGGLMLGRKNDSIGQGLLVVGGATGITGTYMMVDAFKYLGRTRP